MTTVDSTNVVTGSSPRLAGHTQTISAEPVRTFVKSTVTKHVSQAYPCMSGNEGDEVCLYITGSSMQVSQSNGRRRTSRRWGFTWSIFSKHGMLKSSKKGHKIFIMLSHLALWLSCTFMYHFKSFTMLFCSFGEGLQNSSSIIYDNLHIKDLIPFCLLGTDLLEHCGDGSWSDRDLLEHMLSILLWLLMPKLLSWFSLL